MKNAALFIVTFLVAFLVLCPFASAQTQVISLERLAPYGEWKKQDDERINYLIKNPPHIIAGGTYRSFRFKAKYTAGLIPQKPGETAFGIAVEVPWKALMFEDIGGELTAKITYVFRITSADGRVDRVYQDGQELRSSAEELAIRANKTPIAFMRVFALPPGKYKIEILTRCESSLTPGISKDTIEVTI